MREMLVKPVAGLALAVVLVGCSGEAGSAVTTTMALTSTVQAPTSQAQIPDTSTTTTVETGSVAGMPPLPADDVAEWTVEIVDRRPHDPESFTQGLVFEDGTMYESDGGYGESTLREVDPTTGDVLRIVPVDEEVFAEGLELVDDTLLQLTWQSGTLLVWDVDDFTEVERIGYEGEGWGLCLDDDRLVMSDGSATLTFRDPDGFDVVGGVEASLHSLPVGSLNELECVEGLVFANIWRANHIVVIDPETGAVRAVVDASALIDEVIGYPGIDVLNGIAYDEEAGTFLLTGKNWPTLFEVTFVER